MARMASIYPKTNSSESLMISAYIFGALFLAVPVLGTIIFPAQKDLIIATHELISEGTFAAILLFAYLKLQKIAWGNFTWIAFALIALFISDSLYSAGVIRGNGLPPLLGNLSEFGYTFFMVSALGFFAGKRKLILNDPIAKYIFITCLLGHFLLSYKFILSAFYSRESTPSVFNLLNSTIYAIASSLVFAFLIPFILRISKRSEYWFLQSFLLLLISDFAIRYQSAFVSESIFSFAESGWAVATGIFMLVLFFNKRAPQELFARLSILPRIISVRVMLTLAISSASLFLLGGVILINIFSVRNAFHLTNALFLIYAIWVISNALAIKVSEALLEVRNLMFSGANSARGSTNLEALSVINKRLDLAEVDQLILGYNDLVGETNILITELINKERLAAMANVAAQVAHDIRSPLAALGAIEKDLVQVPENTRQIVRQAVGRIRDIANNLIEQHAKAPSRDRGNSEAKASGIQEHASTEMPTGLGVSDQHLAERCLISTLIDGLVTEKRLQYRDRAGIEIVFEQDRAGYGLFADVELAEFKRALSNIINNSVEAITGAGQVLIRTHPDGEQIQIRVIDNGRGIPAKLLSRLGERGATYGKEGGSGLGLFHAKSALIKWRGTLSIESKEGHGTTVSLHLPKAPTPPWFTERLLIPKSGIVVSLDDDVSIHHVWKGRLESARAHEQGVTHQQFFTPKDFKTWVLGNMLDVDRTIFLVDYELLGFKETGLDLLEDLAIGERSILVTSRFEEHSLLARATRLGVRILPKSMAGFVPIESA